ncbi:MAG: hypothetical protein HKP12_11475 [Gammaproteobacteria bacterium]|nr:hypothetical protein [Gammaproteobacteria bacterium]
MKYTVLAMLIFSISASANAFSGADLLAQCTKFVQIIEGEKTDLQHTLNAGLCGGYVLGVQEGFIASSELAAIASEDKGLEPVTGRYWEIPAEVEAENIVRIVVKYLKINPDMQKKPAVLSVINALIQTYPIE